MIFPDNGSKDVINVGLIFTWDPFTSAMAGTPCGSTVYSATTVFLLLDRAQDLDPSVLQPITQVSNTTISVGSSDTISYLKLHTLSKFFRSRTQHNILLGYCYNKRATMGTKRCI